MPIRIPDSLPARAILEQENIFVMTEYRAIHQDMRPLNLLILNLMPTKIVTETQLLEWTKTHVHSTLHVCWGAQAGLYYHYGIPKYSLPKKLFGVFPHVALKKQSPLFRGFDDVFSIPHSRHTENRAEDILKIPELELLSVSQEAGVFAVKSEDNRRFFITGHPEYDPDTLAKEYFREVDKGLPIEIPRHYFPGDDPAQPPVVNWRSAGQLFYTNWLNYYVYQTTPYDITQI